MTEKRQIKKEEEKIDYNDLKKNFNIINRELDQEYEYGEVFLHAKYWTEKIFHISLIFLIISVCLMVLGCIFFISKPAPYVYGSQSNNSLYPMVVVSEKEAIKMVNDYKAMKKNEIKETVKESQ